MGLLQDLLDHLSSGRVRTMSELALKLDVDHALLGEARSQPPESPFASVVTLGDVGRDTVQPRVDFSFALEPVDAAVRPHEHFLAHVQCLLVVPDEAVDHVVDPVLVTAHQFVESRRVALAAFLDQPAVRVAARFFQKNHRRARSGARSLAPASFCL